MKIFCISNRAGKNGAYRSFKSKRPEEFTFSYSESVVDKVGRPTYTPTRPQILLSDDHSFTRIRDIP